MRIAGRLLKDARFPGNVRRACASVLLVFHRAHGRWQTRAVWLTHRYYKLTRAGRKQIAKEAREWAATTVTRRPAADFETRDASHSARNWNWHGRRAARHALSRYPALRGQGGRPTHVSRRSTEFSPQSRWPPATSRRAAPRAWIRSSPCVTNSAHLCGSGAPGVHITAAASSYPGGRKFH
jgi:hypothetical protein